MNNPILHLLGLAKRAGKLEIGEEPVGAVARAKQAKLILLANDVSPNTNRRAATFGQAGNVLHLTLPFTKDEIGMSLGRSSIAMLALTDAGFAGAIGDKLVALDPQRYGPAGEKLRAKADRTLARQREKRQHEKNLQRGKGKPWAVPAQVQKEQEAQREKKKRPKPQWEDKPPRGKKYHKNDSPRGDQRSEAPKKYQGHKSDHPPKKHTSKKPSTGTKFVIKSRPGRSDQS